MTAFATATLNNPQFNFVTSFINLCNSRASTPYYFVEALIIIIKNSKEGYIILFFISKTISLIHTFGDKFNK